MSIERSGRTDLDNVVQVSGVSTELEMMMLDAKVSEWKTRRIAELTKANDILMLTNSELAPKAAFFDQVADSKTALQMRDVVAAMNIPGLGRNKLFAFLREQGILDDRNIPYRQFQDNGYFRVVEQSYTDKMGEAHVNLKTLVYQRGLEYLRRLVERG